MRPRLAATGRSILLALLASLAGSISFVRAQATPGTLDGTFRYRDSFTRTPNALSLQPDGRMVVVLDDGNMVLTTVAGRLEAEFFSLVHKNTGQYRLLRQSSGRLVARAESGPINGRTSSGLLGFGLDGEPDPSFIFPSIPAGGTRNYNGVRDLALGANDRVQLVGTNLPYSGGANGVWVTLDKDGNEIFGMTAVDQPFLVQEQADGKVLIVGSSGLTRRLTNGDLDATFTPSPPGNVLLLKTMADGRILISGPNAGTGVPYVWILKADGSRDTSFDADAVLATYAHNVASVADMLVQSDGKVLLGGNFQGSGQSTALVRLLPSGALDSSFISALTATSPVATMLENNGSLYVGVTGGVFRVVLGAPDGGVIAPQITTPPASGNHAPSAFVTLEVAVSGTPPFTYQWRFNGDPLSGQTGPTYFFQMTQLLIGDYDVVVTNSAGSAASAAAHIGLETADPTVTLPATFPLVLGSPTSLGATITNAVPPLTYQWFKDGLLLPGQTEPSIAFPSPTAADAGTYTFLLNDTFGHSVGSGPCVVSVALPPIPFVMASPQGGTFNVGSSITLSAQFRSDSFTLPLSVQWRKNGIPISGGEVVSHNNGLFDATLTLANVQPEDLGAYDSIATNLGGDSLPTQAAQITVKSAAALDAVDLTFDAGATNHVAFNNPNGDGAIEGIAIQPDDKIIVVGSFKEWNGQPRMNIVRLNEDGSLDASFATHTFTPTVNGEIAVPGVAIAPDGKIYVSGQWGTVDGANTNQLVRLHADGSLDPSFSPGDAAPGYLLLVRPDGTLYNNGVGIVDNAVRYLLRYPAGGALDLQFGEGFSASRFSGSGPSAWFANADGTLILGGGFGANDINAFAQFNLTKLNPDGSLAANFHSFLFENDLVNNLLGLPDGRFVATGDFHGPDSNVRRFNADGSPDSAFSCPVVGASFAPLALGKDGSVLVTANTGNNLVRLQENGAVDENFFVHVDDDIKLIAVDSKGRIVIAGFFTQVTGSFDDASHTHPRRHIARLSGASGSGSTNPPSSGLQSWTQLHFPAGNLSDSLPTADPDGDGLSNLVEYYYQTEPNQPGAVAFAHGTVEERNGSSFAVLSFAKTSNQTEVTAAIEGSANLGADWRVITSGDSGAEITETASEIIVALPVGSALKYLRLTLTIP